MNFFYALIFILVALTGTSYAQQASVPNETGIGTTGFPLPRFASLHSNEINMRTGPGTRYPIEWVYVREGLPVEITAEFEIWRRVRDWEGSEGWVHKSTLTGKRTFIVTGSTKNIYEDADESSPVKAHIEQGAIGQLQGCTPTWCKVKLNDINGYLPKTAFWGVYADETFR
ncbi:MAG: SH3 domain-containing protein [Alphaproteobacteria bacterium]|nr:SH3 domain-containing protein [Alphaproteobacteria bacterium]